MGCTVKLWFLVFPLSKSIAAQVKVHNLQTRSSGLDLDSYCTFTDLKLICLQYVYRICQQSTQSHSVSTRACQLYCKICISFKLAIFASLQLFACLSSNCQLYPSQYPQDKINFVKYSATGSRGQHFSYWVCPARMGIE